MVPSVIETTIFGVGSVAIGAHIHGKHCSLDNRVLDTCIWVANKVVDVVAGEGGEAFMEILWMKDLEVVDAGGTLILPR